MENENKQSDIKLAKARLIPLDGDTPEADKEKHIVVQFNPASLKVALSNTLKAESNGGGETGNSAQYIDKSSSTLAIELLFDTSVASGKVDAYSDVRLQTQKIASVFMKPQPSKSDSKKLLAPKRCLFQWGAFKFKGMVSSYNETLDFFAPEGIPLRARLSLGIKEDKYQFDRDSDVKAQRGSEPPGYSALLKSKDQGTDNKTSVVQARQKAKLDPKSWRETALYNGIENPRNIGNQGISLLQEKLDIPQARQLDGSQGSIAFKKGLSDKLGSTIPGAFQ